MPDEARRAFDQAYCAMLAKRYPGTTWEPTGKRDEPEAPETKDETPE